MARGTRSWLPDWLGAGRRFARSLGPGRLAGHEAIATAVAGDTQQECLQLLIDAQSHRQVLHGCLRFDLPPFAVLAQSPFAVRHSLLLGSAPSDGWSSAV